MFTRIVEVRTKPGKTPQLSNAVSEKVLPILRNQHGFVDEITLISTTEPDRVIALSFWETEADADRYNRENFKTVSDILAPLTETAPKVQTYNVDHSTTHRIAKGKAA